MGEGADVSPNFSWDFRFKMQGSWHSQAMQNNIDDCRSLTLNRRGGKEIIRDNEAAEIICFCYFAFFLCTSGPEGSHKSVLPPANRRRTVNIYHPRISWY